MVLEVEYISAAGLVGGWSEGAWSESWLRSCRCVIILTVKTLSDSHSLSANLMGGGGRKGGVRMECNVNKLYPIDWGVEILFLRESGQAPVVTTTWPNADLTVVEYSVNSMYTFISVELLCTSS